MRKISTTEKLKLLNEIENYISENHIHKLHDLWDYAKGNRPDWCRVLRSSGIFPRMLIGVQREKDGCKRVPFYYF